jgi:hypothetical protein
MRPYLTGLFVGSFVWIGHCHIPVQDVVLGLSQSQGYIVK